MEMASSNQHTSSSVENKKSFIQKTGYYILYKKIFKSNTMQYMWAFLLIFFGLGYLFFFESLFKGFVNTTMGININEYYTPHYDQAVALNPIIGAILLVGGLILWYMPKDTNTSE